MLWERALSAKSAITACTSVTATSAAIPFWLSWRLYVCVHGTLSE
jgi:hypothetical protein